MTKRQLVCFYQDVEFTLYFQGYLNMKKIFLSIGVIILAFIVLTAGSFATETSTLRGDANADGKISASDAALILRHVVGLSTITGQGLINADVDGDGYVTAADAALILRHVVRLIDILDENWHVTPIPTQEPTNTPKPTIKPTATPKITASPIVTVSPKPTKTPTPKPTTKPTATPYVWICKYCGTRFGSSDASYEAWYQHAWYNPGCYTYGRDMLHEPTPSPSPTPPVGANPNGHWENVWIVDVPRISHTVWHCNICGWENDVWETFRDHQHAHVKAGEGSGYHSYIVVDQEEQGHWELQWVES